MSLNDSLKSAPCATCRHCVYRQCARTWPDATETGVVERVIRVDPKAHGFPAQYVWRHWCAKADGSRGYQPVGSSEAIDIYQAYSRAGLVV